MCFRYVSTVVGVMLNIVAIARWSYPRQISARTSCARLVKCPLTWLSSRWHCPSMKADSSRVYKSDPHVLARSWATGRGRAGDFFFQAEDGIRDVAVTGVQTCALPI